MPLLPLIRDATADDFAAIIALNRENEALLSPLPLERLHALHGQAWYHRVACRDGKVAAFLLALRPGANYDSPNYLWFAQHYADFVYIDRIVVSAEARQARLASALYADLIERARQAAIACVSCEFDIDPPNEASRRFHARWGFAAVGSQCVGPAQKRVSLQVLRLGP